MTAVPSHAISRLNAVTLAVTRQLCETDFRVFARYFFRVRKGSKFVFSDHHEVMIQDLMDVWHGRVQNLIVNMPPRYSKTELCVVMFVAWCYVKNPRCEFIHLSYADPLVKDNSDAVRQVMKSAEFQAMWPDVQIVANKDAKEAWGTDQGGVFLARTTGGQVTGFGAGRLDECAGGEFTFSGCVLIDDPLKPDDARHDPLRESSNRKWTETIQSRRNSPRTPTICIMQRIHKKDFTDMLLSDRSFTHPDDQPGRFRHRKMAALIDEGKPTERALWPAKHTVAQLKAMRDQRNSRGEASPLAGETFTGQYQQEPTQTGGTIIKSTWWQHYADRDQVVKLCTYFIVTADTAYTEDEKNDPSSLQVWGFQGKRNAFLLDRDHGWWEFDDLLKRVTALANRWPQAKEVFVENKASGASLAQTLRKRLIGRKVVQWTPKQWWWPDDKVGRMKQWSVQVHGGAVWLPSMETDDPSYQPWVTSYVDEAGAFNAEMTHAHDDDCDAGNMACSVWVRKGGGIVLTDSSNGETVGSSTNGLS